MAGHHYGWSRGSNYCTRPLRAYIYVSQKIFTGAERSELFITKGDHRCFAGVNANVSRNFLRVSYIIIISILHPIFLSLSATHSEFFARRNLRGELFSREEERKDREKVVQILLKASWRLRF